MSWLIRDKEESRTEGLGLCSKAQRERQLFSLRTLSQLMIAGLSCQFQPAALQEKAINLRLIGF